MKFFLLLIRSNESIIKANQELTASLEMTVGMMTNEVERSMHALREIGEENKFFKVHYLRSSLLFGLSPTKINMPARYFFTNNLYNIPNILKI